MIESVSESDSTQVGRTYRQKKITDFPAVITNRRKIEKYRHDFGQTEFKRVTLEKPQKTNLDDVLRHCADAETKTKKRIAASISTASGVGYGSETSPQFKAHSFSFKSTHKVKHSGSTDSSPTSNKSVLSHTSSRSSNCGFDVFANYQKTIEPFALSVNGNILNQVPLYDPLENVGLFSTYGVSGTKARFSSADKLHRSGSDTDLNSIDTSRLSICPQGSTLHRSNSLIDLNKLHGNLRKVSLPRNQKDQTNKLKPNPNVKPKADNRNPGSCKNVHASIKHTKNSTQKSLSKTPVKDALHTVSTKNRKAGILQEKKTKSGDTQPKTNYRRREITTQSLEMCEGEFEVVKYLF